MSFFGDYGVTVDEVNENPFAIPHNTYQVVVSDAEIKTFKKNPEVEYFTIEYQIAVGPEAGKSATKMFRRKPMTAADDPKWATNNARTLSNFKKELLDLGLTEGEINSFNPETDGHKLIGKRGTAVMGPQKGNEDYNSVSHFTLGGADSAVVSENASGTTPVSDEKTLDALLGW